MANRCLMNILAALVAAQVAARPAAPDAVEQPTLPLVSDVLKKASKTVDAFTAKAASMQERVLQRQNATRKTLAKSKAHYEELLVGLENQTTALIGTNADLQSQIDQLIKVSEATKEEAKRLQRSNEVLWNSLGHLEAKLDTATQFTADSLHMSDLSAAPELAVLDADVRPPSTLESFLKMAHSLSPHAAAQANRSTGRPRSSLLQLHMNLLDEPIQLAAEDADSPTILKSRRSAETYVPLLMKSLEELQVAESEGEQALKKQFDEAAAEKQVRIEDLKRKQQSLRDTRVEHRNRNAEFAKARDHLKERRDQLVQRLKGVRTFAASIDTEATESITAQRKATGLKAELPSIALVNAKNTVVAKAAESSGSTAVASSMPRTPSLRAPIQASQLTTFVGNSFTRTSAETEDKTSSEASSMWAQGSFANASQSTSSTAHSSWFSMY